MKSRKEFGKYVQDRRKEAGLSQLEIAKKLGYSSSQNISNVERGVCDMPAKMVRPWSKLIKVSFKGLFEARYKIVLEAKRKELRRGV